MNSERLPEPSRILRVISWNLAHRVNGGAAREADLLSALAPDLALFQEANANSIDALTTMAGFDWVRLTRPTGKAQKPRSTYIAAIAGRGDAPVWLSPPFDVPFPERVIAVQLCIAGVTLIAASYHAPPGVSWGIAKARQAVVFARWLADQQAKCILGADANTPLVDHPDFALTRTHWHTGIKGLAGEPGDDILWGSTKVHALEDAFRVWLKNDPVQMQAIRDAYPAGPLAVSHRTGRRVGKPGTPRRFDSIWVSNGIRVVSMRYLYSEGVSAGSDHAVVLAELQL